LNLRFEFCKRLLSKHDIMKVLKLISKLDIIQDILFKSALHLFEKNNSNKILNWNVIGQLRYNKKKLREVEKKHKKC